ncbi:hypothetical protein [Aquimarina sp. MAR_2010_214]|uniref:hypothetical protein n=1 Tax=Aquimarina sp. MAR_2010_214 TaxID=1250026 RepID=UPI001E3DE103|nr:hypothetical protein [Aquimarina sp. MAR_2010_214]
MPAHVDNQCRFKWEKVVPVNLIRLSSYGQKFHPVELFDYAWYQNPVLKKTGKPLMPSMGFGLTWLDKPYEPETLEEMMQADIKDEISDYNSGKKRWEEREEARKKMTPEQHTKIQEPEVKDPYNDTGKLKRLRNMEQGKITLKTARKKDGFYELPTISPYSTYYYGYTPELKLPIRLMCKPDNVCSAKVVLDKHLRFSGSARSNRHKKNKFIDDLNAYAKEHETAIKEILWMEKQATELLNKESIRGE